MATATGKSVSASGLDIIHTKSYSNANTRPNGLRKFEDLESESTSPSPRGLFLNTLSEVIGLGANNSLLSQAITDIQHGHTASQKSSVSSSGFALFDENGREPGKMRI